jgi:hypothetical protein
MEVEKSIPISFRLLIFAVKEGGRQELVILVRPQTGEQFRFHLRHRIVLGPDAGHEDLFDRPHGLRWAGSELLRPGKS